MVPLRFGPRRGPAILTKPMPAWSSIDPQKIGVVKTGGSFSFSTYGRDPQARFKTMPLKMTGSGKRKTKRKARR